jgi:peptide/nickel transport system permease protein
MLHFLLRRALQAVLIVFVVATVTFVLIHLAPGDPFSYALEDPRITPEIAAQWRQLYGLDRPLVEQYALYLANLARGSLGRSFVSGRPVAEMIWEAVPNTLILMVTALTVSFLVGAAIGAYQAAHQNSLLDRVLSLGTVVSSALPEFWVGLGAMAIMSHQLGLFPTSGMTDAVLYRYFSPMRKLADIAEHVVLPAGTLALVLGAAIARFQRVAMLEAIPLDFVRTARAKGASSQAVIYRHVFRNSLLPIVTLIGLALPTLFGGALFIELIFSWPGMGRVAADALALRDYPVVMGSVLMTTVFVAAGSALADLLAAAVDPRVRDA